MRRHIGIILVIAVAILTVFNSLTKGNEPECRNFYGPDRFADMKIDPEIPFLDGLVMMGGNLDITVHGKLVAWYVVSKVGNGTFWLDTWRNTTGSLYRLISTQLVNITEPGFKKISPDYFQKTDLHPGDRFGFHFTGNVTPSLIDTVDLTDCYTGNYTLIPGLLEEISTENLTRVDCLFAFRYALSTREEPCGHLYHGVADLGLTTSQSIHVYADTVGVCAYKCLADDACISFNFRRAINEEGKKTNVCDINMAKLLDDVEPEPDDGNYTDYYHFN